MLEGNGSGREPRDLSNRIQFRTNEVAEVAGVSVTQVKVWLRTEVLRSYTIGSMRFVHKSDLDEFIDRHRGDSFGLSA